MIFDQIWRPTILHTKIGRRYLTNVLLKWSDLTYGHILTLFVLHNNQKKKFQTDLRKKKFFYDVNKGHVPRKISFLEI